MARRLIAKYVETLLFNEIQYKTKDYPLFLLLKLNNVRNTNI